MQPEEIDYKVNELAVERVRRPKRLKLSRCYVKSFETKVKEKNKEEKENA